MKATSPIEHIELRGGGGAVHRRLASRYANEVDVAAISVIEPVDDGGLSLAVRTPGREDFEKDRLRRFTQIEEPVRRRNFERRGGLTDLRLTDDRRLRSRLHRSMLGPEIIVERGADDNQHEDADRRHREALTVHALRSFRSTASAPGAPYATKSDAIANAKSKATCGQSATAASLGPKHPQLAAM